MDQREFNRADAEVEKMVNDNHAKYRAAEKRVAASGKMPSWAETGKKVHQRAQMRRALNTMWRFLPGLVFLGAASRGLMDATLALLLIAISAVWALNYFLWRYRYE